ncbi:hypothetical protein BY996DRAFT_6806889 [Phakopsora pachyrhizi]|nr:hypothetical protein BY996DRAFT_8126338 [Phakopsora pachyrhizi]KAI8459106.1 hypothetical protein BY996DRAFT_6806889 [Phakopsora pachyrhizi]
MVGVSGLSLWICGLHWFLKILVVIAYTTALLVPLTSQFFFPASPIFTWVILYFSNRYIPMSFRSNIHIWVSILPTLESVLYGANISDILTRYTNPVFDIIAWLPYGVLHFVLPFVTAIFLFVFGGPGAVKFFGKAFGYMNLAGVVVQILFPCAPPWYELSHGITPANYGIPGEAGGLARIDKIFHSHGYTTAFGNSPIVFGAFPSLHAGCATLEAMFLSHYFPRWRVFYWTYAFILYWSTMYLTHHYLVDLVAGGSFAISAFYLFLTDDQRHLPMLSASIAGEEESIAKGYHTGIRGMLGHRGANGTWINSGSNSNNDRLDHSYHSLDQDDGQLELNELYYNSSKKFRSRDEEEGMIGRETAQNGLLSRNGDFRSTMVGKSSPPISDTNFNPKGSNTTGLADLQSIGVSYSSSQNSNFAPNNEFNSIVANSLNNSVAAGGYQEPITRARTPRLESEAEDSKT